MVGFFRWCYRTAGDYLGGILYPAGQAIWQSPFLIRLAFLPGSGTGQFLNFFN